ncbi:MAG: LysR family transcriptional regulator [Desulfovibrio sp.]
MNLLDPWQLRTFLAAAAAPSFRQAASDISLAPSTVTMQIQALEETLGVPLFQRAAGRMVLTEHGQRLVGHARRWLELEAEIRRGIGGDETASPELSVRISESLGLELVPAILPRFRQRFPHTRLILATQSRQGLVGDLRQGSVDLGIILGEPFAASGVAMEEIHREPLVVIVPPRSDLARLAVVGPEELAVRELLVTRHIWSVRRRIESALARVGKEPASLTECTSLEIVKRCVAAGQGVALAPRLAVRRECAAGLLAALPWAEGTLEVPVVLLWQADRPRSEVAAYFARAVREALEEGGEPSGPSESVDARR